MLEKRWFTFEIYALVSLLLTTISKIKIPGYEYH